MSLFDYTTAPSKSIRGKIFLGNSFIDDAVIAIDKKGKIAYSGSYKNYNSKDFPSLYNLPEDEFIVPGLVDIHCHGGYGGDFSSGSLDDCILSSKYSFSSGTTSVIASIVTSSPKKMISAAKSLKQICDMGLIAGIHSEGPFISRDYSGAQNFDDIQNVHLGVLEDLVDAAGGYMRTMTYAPELENSEMLVQFLAQRGIIPAIGHTGANFQAAHNSALNAYEILFQYYKKNTPTLATHIFNGMPSLHHRNSGPIAAILERCYQGKLVVELIADGIHINPEIISFLFTILGSNNIALITDSISAAGLCDGSYMLGDKKISVLKGKATLEGSNVLAGSTTSLFNCLKIAVNSGVSLEDALISATIVPARIIGQENCIGSLSVGSYADFLTINKNLDLLSVTRRGELVSHQML